ncbi:MAG: DNRLRE domain-containing protein [Bacteroidaceae bacterium]|nr:DNRLRE domain-containing protein [Bacteroidaceae bacterium]MEA5100679.1 DNRLRE domain-containing protein [Bacteroidales bacterium]
MKKIIVSFLAMFLLTITSSQIAFSQTTVIFKPNGTIGKDVNIGDVQYTNLANLNEGEQNVLNINAWTFSDNLGIGRALIKFDELASIPTEAIITDVKLKLYGVSSTDPNSSNSVYPGSPFSQSSNAVYVQRVTSAWDESIVTWNTQPTTTTVNQITIPNSEAQYNWNYTIENSSELNTMVQDMVSNPNTNHGFMLRLINEAVYRRMGFYTSDHTDSTKRPELQVTYLYNDTCNSNFSYTMPNALDPTTLTFNAKVENGQHIWRYGSQSLSTNSSFTHTFTPTNECKELTHEVISSNGNCSTSINLYICNTNQDTTSIDEINSMNNAEIIISPNPSKDFWNVSINSKEKLSAEIIIRDALGKVVLMEEKNIYIGENNIPINGKNLNKGIYIIEIKGKGISYSQKLIKQ